MNSASESTVLPTEPCGNMRHEESGLKDEPNTEMRNPETGPAEGVSSNKDMRSVKTKRAGFEDTKTRSEAMRTVVAPGRNLGVAHFKEVSLVTVAADRTLDPKKQYTS